MKQILQSPWLPITILALADLGMIGGLLPRTTSFLLAFIAIAYILTAPRSSTVFFVLASLPLAPALPIPGFDTFALWRPLVLAYALREAAAHRAFLRTPFKKLCRLILPYEWLGLAIFALAGLSLPFALDPTAGLRKLVFLANAALLYIVLRGLLWETPTLRASVLRGLLAALGILLLVGAAQYITTAFVSLFDFWQGWALDAIPVFYGEELGNVLSASNTWFSYYADAPPTLRMFSLLPDSHSFGLLMVLGFLLAAAPFVVSKENSRWRDRWLILVFGLAIFLSGSRGLWISAVPAALAAFACAAWWQRHRLPQRALGRTVMGIFALFFLLFPFASAISSRAQGVGAEDTRANLAFERAKSIFDLEELSNRSRIGIWLTGLKSVAGHPLLGVGFGNTAVALDEDVAAARRGASAHNLYLDFSVELGVLGGLLSVAFFLALLQRFGLPWLRNASLQYFHTFSLLFALGIVWIAAYNLVDVVLLNDRALLVFLAILALVASPSYRQNHENRV
ncbi:MAG: hypothetical protein A2991_01940 [Candidatus Terrybacteria bacterium RIFCSPLOWO2_01_FULL_58_14]|uniref:O-antigen ligase-related domain-containing protein n=2 Tax=Candidatus Terryibacteriota TaxID=1817920 RepID=A0A1G2PX74_9BACT|nr:MAG: hypothetical protein A2682_04020 [Candidatus Terrybacteria bacterium RIFCSPHIGHO2_01_FULL_58_15]OHA52906.1 MAG: hypothetical protein A2991_01940 [Candidatus Terrybacteria bacterium RIFCSPLOWO2_01_FULL_58_14]